MHGVLLAHGYSTASSIADTVNKIAGATLLDSFDMPIDIQPEDIAKKISNYIHIRRVRNGLILMVDMGSLEKLPELLKSDLDFPIAIFNNVSTQLALFCGK
jgi:Transcriptional antiterminator